MTILRRGKLPPKMVFHGECRHCHTIIECYDNELKYVEGTSHPKEYVVKCPFPECPREISVIRGKHPKAHET